MNRNLLLGLAAATVLAIVLVMLAGDDRGRPEVDAGPLVPGLSQQINAIEAIDVVAPGGAIAARLRRDNARWQVLERDDYEAEFRQVVELLRTLAEAERAEPRTENPDWYARLGVADVGDAAATGRRLDFPGTELPSVIVGQVDPTDSGSYVRLVGDAQAWLADRVIELAADPVAWLEPGIMDISGEDLAEIKVTHPDGETVVLQKAGADGTWVLRDVPEGRSAGPAWQRTALANGIRGMNLEDVRRFSPPHADDAVLTELVTDDGLRFSAWTWREGAGDQQTAWVHFTVAAASAAANDRLDAQVDDRFNDRASGEAARSVAGDSASSEVGESAPLSEAAADLSNNQSEATAAERMVDVVAVDGRLSPWAFRIPARRADDLTPRMAELLEPLDENDED